MAPDLPPVGPRPSRRWLVLVLAAIVLIVVIAALAMRRSSPAAAEDCEDKPPPNAFAVPACDDGGTPAGTKPGTPAEPSRPRP